MKPILAVWSVVVACKAGTESHPVRADNASAYYVAKVWYEIDGAQCSAGGETGRWNSTEPEFVLGADRNAAIAWADERIGLPSREPVRFGCVVGAEAADYLTVEKTKVTTIFLNFREEDGESVEVCTYKLEGSRVVKSCQE